MPQIVRNPRAAIALAAALVAVLSAPVLAVTAPGTGAPAVAGLDWGDMSMRLFGGLALFLLGMDIMASALKAAAGERMKLILARLTTNRLFGALTGAAVTAVIQSSSVTTVLVVGFVTAQLMSLTQAIGVIMGANVGTTVTAQIVAFKVTHYALAMVAVGFGLQFFLRREWAGSFGRILLGLGLVFFGMGVMGEGMRPLRDYEPFLELMGEARNPWIAIGLAAAFTGLVQSSSATTGIVISMASQGLVPLETGIALIFGSNIGTCVTALLAAIGQPREAIRAAAVHVLFNLAGVFLWIGFIEQLAALVTLISPVSTATDPAGRLAAEVPRQIANAHTVFNLANTLIFIGLAPQFARMVERLVPERPAVGLPELKPRYLDKLLLDTPALALDGARRELHRMGARVDDMLQEIMPALLQGDDRRLAMVAQMDDEVDRLHGFIVRYLGEISRTRLSDAQTRELVRLLEAVNNLESVGDIIETNLVILGRQRLAEGIRVSAETSRLLYHLRDSVAEQLHDAVEAATRRDPDMAETVLEQKEPIHRQVEQALLHQAERLVAEAPDRVATYRLETDVIEVLKRVYYHARRIAETVVEAARPDTAASPAASTPGGPQ